MYSQAIGVFAGTSVVNLMQAVKNMLSVQSECRTCLCTLQWQSLAQYRSSGISSQPSTLYHKSKGQQNPLYDTARADWVK